MNLCLDKKEELEAKLILLSMALQLASRAS